MGITLEAVAPSRRNCANSQGIGDGVGIANLSDCLRALDEAEIRQTFDKHRVPSEMIVEVIGRGWRVPWVLADIRALYEPITY